MIQYNDHLTNIYMLKLISRSYFYLVIYYLFIYLFIYLSIYFALPYNFNITFL